MAICDVGNLSKGCIGYTNTGFFTNHDGYTYANPNAYTYFHPPAISFANAYVDFHPSPNAHPHATGRAINPI